MGDTDTINDDGASQNKAVRKERRAYFLRKWTRVDVVRASFVVVVHLLCILAPFNYKWEALRFGLITAIVTNLNVAFSYHRNLTHRSFKLPRWLEYSFAYSALFALQGHPIDWVSTHRFHHKFTDTDRDPHSPIEGFWFSHVLWIFDTNYVWEKCGKRNNVMDLKQQWFYRFLGNTVALHILTFWTLVYFWGGLPYLTCGVVRFSIFFVCSDLRHIYLQGNRFSGEIPEGLFSLSKLVRLNLAENSFTGEISSGFANLTRLKTLYLEDNQLSGSIPDLDLPLAQFNVSNNSLNGSIPKNLRKFNSDSFLQTSLCGKPLKICPDEETVPSQPTSGGNRTPPTVEESKGKKKKNKLSGGVIAGIVIGCVVGFALIVLILMVLCRKKGNQRSRAVDSSTIKQQETEIPGDKAAGEVAENGNGYSVTAAAAAALTGNAKSGDANGPASKKLVFFGNATKVFDLEDLLRASAEVLGKGTFGTAYKAVLDAVTVVAVKRLKDVMMPDKEFREKIELVGAMDHENLVPLRAYYFSRDEKLLVHDFMPMGSLSALLHGNRGAGRNPLNWDVRSKIALGAARGLDYLHSQGNSTSHGNVKSSNILLTKSHDAKVSDFGLSQLVAASATTPNRATGYRAPEVTDPKRVSQKGDVYSFGVVLLELITGKAPSNSVMNEEGVDLPRWVKSVGRDEWRREVLDSELLSLATEEEEMMAEMVQLGIECTSQHPDKRPEMAEVVRKIEDFRRSGPDQVDEAD